MKYTLPILLGIVLIIFALVLFRTPKNPKIYNAIVVEYCADGTPKTVQHEDGRLEHFVCKEKKVSEPYVVPDGKDWGEDPKMK